MNEVRVRGWLLVLCAWLLAVAPFLFAAGASRLVAFAGMRGPGFAAILVARLAAVSFGIAAGLALLRRRPAAVAIAKAAIAVSAGVDLLTYFTPFFPRNLPASDITLLLVVSLTIDALWIIYLSRSRRVRLTYADTW